MTIRPQTKGARVVANTVFHMAILGDFSRRGRDFEVPGPLQVDSNQWDSLFEKIAPRCSHAISLPTMDDTCCDIEFLSLSDFRDKALIQRIPLLKALDALSNAVGGASAEQPLDLKALLSMHPAISTLADRAAAQQNDGVIDLLSMVDIGEDDGLNLPKLKRLFSNPSYTGHERMQTQNEIKNLIQDVLKQVHDNPDFKHLLGQWRALKQLLPFLRRQGGNPQLVLTLIDCPKDQLCDAVFLNFIRPDKGEPRPLDLLVCTEPLGALQPDRHIIYHLGRMAEGLSVPFLLEAAVSLFGCKTWSLLSHVPDISGRLSGPQTLKWRKLREESGSQWLFLCANPYGVCEDDQDAEPTAPACTMPALMMVSKLQMGLWPSEMMGTWGRLEAPGTTLARLSEAQLNDLSFEGFVPLAGLEGESQIELAGITSFASIKIAARDQANSANILEYTLPYRFYSGCCSRFLEDTGVDNLPQALRDFTAVKKEEDFTCEKDGSTIIFRIKPPFTILGVQPDLILVLEEDEG